MFSIGRRAPTTGKVMVRRSGSTRMTPVVKRTLAWSFLADRNFGNPTLLPLRLPDVESDQFSGDTQVGDPRGVRLFGVGLPPRGNGRLLCVEPFAQRIEVPRHRCVGGIDLLRIHVGLYLGECPVVGEPATTELGPDAGG